MTDFVGRRILVVDDEAANRRLIQAILAPEGGTIVHAADGAAALAILLRGDIDLVLLDVMMPGIDGVEVCARIRDRSRGDYVPVILVTALADAQSRARGKAAGADDFLTKPVHEDELVARARNLLRMRAYQLLLQEHFRDAEREAKRWRIVSEVAGAVAVCRDYPSLLRQISASLAPHLPIDSACVIDVDGERDRASWTGRLGDRAVLRLAPADAPCNEPGSRDAIAIPVFGAGALHGVFVASRSRPFSDEELAVLEQLAPHVSNAVNNVRLHVRAEALLKAREELAQMIVHDLRSPLMVVQTNVELALDESELSVEDRHAMLGDTNRALARVIAMVSDLLDTSAAEAGRLALDRHALDLVGLARGVAAQMPSYRAGVVGDGEVSASIDAQLMCRVLENLVGNASRFVPAGGRIEIAVRADGDTAVIAVANDGPTISPEHRASLFEKYARGTSHGRTRGLGLYFCRLVVEAHGGTIRETAPAHGACFEIRLPRQEAASAAA